LDSSAIEEEEEEQQQQQSTPTYVPKDWNQSCYC
jgi:hypothetical protein